MQFLSVFYTPPFYGRKKFACSVKSKYKAPVINLTWVAQSLNLGFKIDRILRVIRPKVIFIHLFALIAQPSKQTLLVILFNFNNYRQKKLTFSKKRTSYCPPPLLPIE